MEMPKMTLPEDIIEAKIPLDEEDTGTLLVECYGLLSQILERKNPRWIQNQGLKLLKQLDTTLSWHRLH